MYEVPPDHPKANRLRQALVVLLFCLSPPVIFRISLWVADVFGATVATGFRVVVGVLLPLALLWWGLRSSYE